MPIYIYRLNTKIRLTMLCLSGFELYPRWVPLRLESSDAFISELGKYVVYASYSGLTC